MVPAQGRRLQVGTGTAAEGWEIGGYFPSLGAEVRLGCFLFWGPLTWSPSPLPPPHVPGFHSPGSSPVDPGPHPGLHRLMLWPIAAHAGMIREQVPGNLVPRPAGLGTGWALGPVALPGRPQSLPLQFTPWPREPLPAPPPPWSAGRLARAVLLAGRPAIPAPTHSLTHS